MGKIFIGDGVYKEITIDPNTKVRTVATLDVSKIQNDEAGLRLKLDLVRRGLLSQAAKLDADQGIVSTDFAAALASVSEIA